MDDLISRQEALDALGEEPLVWNGWWELYKNKQWHKDVEAIKSVPSAQPEKSTEKRTETHACDLISRQAAIDALCEDYCSGHHDCKCYPKCENLRAIQDLPSAQPEQNPDEWCTDCKEYDGERHCCPRFNRVIRTALADASRWISCDEQLPETDEMMLVTAQPKKGAPNVNRAYYMDGAWHGSGSMSNVIAWMPLPDPYEPEE